MSERRHWRTHEIREDEVVLTFRATFERKDEGRLAEYPIAEPLVEVEGYPRGGKTDGDDPGRRSMGNGGSTFPLYSLDLEEHVEDEALEIEDSGEYREERSTVDDGDCDGDDRTGEKWDGGDGDK